MKLLLDFEVPLGPAVSHKKLKATPCLVRVSTTPGTERAAPVGGRIRANSRQAPTPARGAASATPRAPGNNPGATPGSPAPEPPAADNDGGAGQAEPTPQSGSKLKRGGISQTDHNNEAGPFPGHCPPSPYPPMLAARAWYRPSPLIPLSWDPVGGFLGDPDCRLVAVPSWPAHRMLGLSGTVICLPDPGLLTRHWAQCGWKEEG